MMVGVARAVAFHHDEDSGADILVLAEEPEGEGWTLEIQRARHFDHRDRTLGQDDHCVVLDAARVRYGALERAEVRDGRLRLRFTPEAAEDLGVDRDCELLLPGSEEEETVRRALPALLGG